MSSVEMKNFTNMFCRLIGSLRDSEFICHEFMADALQIKSSFHKMAVLPTDATDPDLLIDDDKVKRLQKENEEMKNLLADYHRGVELLMAAYRERVLENMLRDQIDAGKTANSDEFFDPKLFDTIIKQSEKIYRMLNVMRCAAGADADTEYLVAEQMAFLRKENEILKELYEASKKFGSVQNRLRFNELSLKEMGVQTEKNVEKYGGCVDTNKVQCAEQTWEIFEKWKQENTVDGKSKFDSEDEDEITVVDFKMHDKRGAQNTDKKNVSAQAYTF